MKAVVLWLLRLGLAGVFGYAGVMKLQDPAGFANEIAGYRMLPAVVEAWLALYLPWLEIAIGVGVLLPWTMRGAALLQVGLMGVFIVALSLAWARGLDITCGCFGSEAKAANYPWLIGRDVVFLIGSGFVLIWDKLSGHDEESQTVDQTASENAARQSRVSS